MDRSGMFACIVGGIMLAMGGWFAYDGYNKADAQNKKLKQAQDDLTGQVGKAEKMEDRLTKLSSVMGFTDMRNWFSRTEYLKKWTSEIASNSAVSAKMTESGTDMSKTLLPGDIATAWTLMMQQGDDSKKVYLQILARDEEIRNGLNNDIKAFAEGIGNAPTPDQSQETQDKNAADTAEKLAKLRMPAAWASPPALRWYLNSFGKRFADLKATGGEWYKTAAEKAKPELDIDGMAPVDDKDLLTAKPAANVKALLDVLDFCLTAITEKIAATEKSRDDARANTLAIIGESDAEGKKVKAGSMSDEEKKKDDAIKDLQTQITTLRTQIADKIREGESSLASLDKEITEETTKLNQAVSEKSAKIKELEAKLSDTKERYAKLQARQAAVVEATEADGQLLWVDNERGVGYVDLGRTNTLFRGTRFEVFRIAKAGKKIVVGEMEILELGDTRSRVAITKLANPANPPLAGDSVSNVSFDRRKAKVFSIAGQLRFKYSRDDIRRRLEEWGAKVSDDCSPSTSFLIVGDRYQEDPNWQRAMDIGTPVMREQELYDALGIE